MPGVGEKTAAKLINDYGDLDGVFANLDKCTPKLRENLKAHEAQVRSNALATPLVRDVELDVDVAELRMGAWDTDEVRKLFGFLEFRTLWDRLLEAVGPEQAAGPAVAASEVLEADVTVVRRPVRRGRARSAGWRKVKAPLPVAAAWAGIEGRSTLVGLAFVTGDDSRLVRARRAARRARGRRPGSRAWSGRGAGRCRPTG